MAILATTSATKLATKKPAAFKFMNATLPLFVLHIQTTDMALLTEQVRARVAQAPEFFLATPVVLSLAAVAETDFVPDWASLCDFLREMGMRPAGIMDASEAQQQSAVAYGLAQFPDRVSRNKPTAGAETVDAVTAADLASGQTELPLVEPVAESVTEAATEATAQAAKVSRCDTASPSAARTSAPPEQTYVRRPALVIDKPVRTGQRIHAEGTDLIVLAVVSAGAELIADGDIHVYAPLRGRALAGARGNTSARIFSQSMEAELVSIAGNFKILEDVPAELKGKPTQVFLDQEGEQPRVVMQPLGALRTA